MKASGRWLLLAVVSGAALGVVAKRSIRTTTQNTVLPIPVRVERPAPVAIPSAAGGSVDDLISPGRTDRYVQLADWLPHANAADLQRLWDAWHDTRSMTAYRRLLLARWVELDLKAAHAAAGDDEFFWEAWIALDPEAALRAAWETHDDQRIYRVTRQLIARDPDMAKKLIAAQGGSVREADLTSGYLAAGRYHEAINAVSGTDQAFRLHGIFADWIKVDPEGALDWAAATRFTTGSSGIDDEKRMLELVRPHADKAQSLVARLPAGEFRQRVEAGLVTALAEKDPQTAIDFARTLSSPSSRRTALAAVGMGLAKSNPDAAIKVYSELVANGARRGHEHALVLYGDKEGCDKRDNSFDPFVESLMEGFPDRTLNAAMAMDSSPAGDAAVQDLASRWMSRDLWQFSKWLASQPVNPRRDGLAGELVGRMLGENRPNFEQAAQWVGVITDTDLASTHAERLVSDWRGSDPDGLNRYLQSAAAAKVIVETSNSSH